MWAYIMTDASTLTNYNFGFSTHKSDILIHLSQWQYWWWFWFSLFWALYFFIAIRLVHKRTMQFSPILNTSSRGHGKWGDFVVVFIPLSWCANILVNSNFILRMIEWQNESSLFTLRVQGKQWYWVYKFDALAAYNIITAPKNIGNNNWVITTPNESYCADSYYQALLLGAQLEYKTLYLKYLDEEKLSNGKILANSEAGVKINFNFDKSITVNSFRNLKTFNSYYDFFNIDNTYNVTANILENSAKKQYISFYKGVLNKNNLDVLFDTEKTIEKPIFFVTKFNNLFDLKVKTDDSAPLWGFRQKKYKRLQKFKFLPKVKYDPTTFQPVKTNNESPFQLKSTLVAPLKNIINDEPFNYQQAITTSRQRAELVPVNLARRLLRTKRTLVLPAHVNLTVITNSYDVVHSWFIPGLGLKLDCVPGRSTHHSFYIDNVGFYYGQCAEICGRYHHHMPIRICALPYDQFLVWWNHKGLKRLHRVTKINTEKTFNPNLIQAKYVW